jgi:octaprenyl-diphosphate synthase
MEAFGPKSVKRIDYFCMNMGNLSLDSIKMPVEQEMASFEGHFREAMRSKAPLLDVIMQYILRRKGKQMRPLFVFLSAGMCGGIREETYRGASLIELLHTATLVHDDVVDDSSMRRGFFSINALWKNKIAVLVGDYLLSRGLLLSVKHKDWQLLEIVSEAVREMSEGELLQIEKARRLDITEEIYFDVIRQKTASLIASCCGVGAASSGSDEATVQRMRDVGSLIGIAFQIKDDLFDYETANKTGKPSGIDIKESKMTLPLIHALSKAGFLEKRSIISIVGSKTSDEKKIRKVLDFVNEKGGLEYARNKMDEYAAKALDMVGSFPESPYKSSFCDLVRYTIERDK